MEKKSLSIKELKRIARGRLIGRYTMSVLCVTTILIVEILATMLNSGTNEFLAYSYIVMLAISLIVDLLMGVFFYGQAHFFLRLIRLNDDISSRDIFYGFKNNTDKAILVQVPFTIASLIGCIPTIIYNFKPELLPQIDSRVMPFLLLLFNALVVFILNLFLGLSFYILCDRPELTPMEIFSESARYMKNKKVKYLLIHISLIPLAIISALAFGIGIIWFSVFQKAVIAAFYLDTINEEMVDPTKKVTEIKPDDFSTLDIRL